jgi:NitT/TauT family transport system ATP-binding protein
MVVAESLGAGQINVPLLTPVALGLGGNAITVSATLWAQMRSYGAVLGASPDVQSAALARVVAQRADAGLAPLTLAMVFPFSCHNYELRDWLISAHIDPDRDVRLVVLPPPLLVDALRTGQIDGFCVGEPWSSLAVDAGIGVIVAVASDIWRRPPEKVLGMRVEFAQKHPEVVAALVRAVAAAAEWASQAGNREELSQLLAQPRYVGAPPALLRAALDGKILAQAGSSPIERPEFIVLGGSEATMPRHAHAEHFYLQMLRWKQISAGEDCQKRAAQTFRADLYRGAMGMEPG